MPERLDELMVELGDFAAARDWDQFHDPKNLVMLLASEVGELSSEYRWIRSEEADGYTADPQARNRVEDEVADITIALLNLCRRLGVDVIGNVRRKLLAMESAYPADAVRGCPDRPAREAR